MFHLTSDYLLHKFEIFGVPFQNSGISYGQQSASLVSSESPQTHTHLIENMSLQIYIQVAVQLDMIMKRI